MPKSKSEMLASAVSVFAAELVAQLNRIHAKVAAVAAGCGAYEQGKLVGLANGLVIAMELVGELERVGLWREMDGESERGTAGGAVLPQAGPAVHR